MFRRVSANRLFNRPVAVSLVCALCIFAFAQSGAKREITATSGVTVAAEPQPLGKGYVRPWVSFDKAGKPNAVGLTFTEDALAGLPPTVTPGLIGYEYLLPLPKEASATLFNHVGLNWNPKGHIPPGVYNVPHFDFHFYMISPEEREKITARGDDLIKCRKAPPAQFVPEGYIFGPDSEEPGMGSHWVEPGSHEFHGKAFTHTFVYGTYDGQIIFFEPMVTKAFLESRPNVTVPLKLPAKYPKPGYYPTRYSVKYNEDAKEYTVALEGLMLRQ